MARIDLTPFGFTHTESRAYAALLRLGPATGYEVGRSTRLARANAYAALEGLVSRGAAARGEERPRRYRPVDPATLLARLAARQAEQLDALGRALEGATIPAEPGSLELHGLRQIANTITQLVARAERRVEGVVAAAFWAPTLPAWRAASSRAELSVTVAGEASGTQGLAQGHGPAELPTLLVVDQVHVVTAEHQGDDFAGLWVSHPLLARVALKAVAALT